MSSGLPEFLDLAHVTRQPLERAGRVRIGAMPRLCAALADTKGEAMLHLQARNDGAGQIVLQGRVQAELTLSCQRCLKPVLRPVSADFYLAWVRDEEQAVAVQTGNCDPLLSADGRIRLAELVEDELLLALPIVALHDIGECEARPGEPVTRIETPEIPAQQNPFAVLKQLKEQR
ncbi:MAG TPA: YceD family protein [Gammaproteobacteria bacterium]|nr:YceD family protein [Gammaproteobacteria bacterium]